MYKAPSWTVLSTSVLDAEDAQVALVEMKSLKERKFLTLGLFAQQKLISAVLSFPPSLTCLSRCYQYELRNIGPLEQRDQRIKCVWNWFDQP